MHFVFATAKLPASKKKKKPQTKENVLYMVVHHSLFVNLNLVVSI